MSKFIRRLTKKTTSSQCTHLASIQTVTPSSEGCFECLQTGDTWVHLRLCLTCGHVGCCDDSKNRHARKHADASGHPIIRSFEPGENWMWCYVDQTYVKPDPSMRAGES